MVKIVLETANVLELMTIVKTLSTIQFFTLKLTLMIGPIWFCMKVLSFWGPIIKLPNDNIPIFTVHLTPSIGKSQLNVKNLIPLKLIQYIGLQGN